MTREPLPSRVTKRALNSTHSVLPLAVLVGIVTGLVVTGLRYLSYDVLWPLLLGSKPWLIVAAPAFGIIVSGLVLSAFADRREVHDAEAYLAAYHRGESEKTFTSLLAKLTASLATVGFGGSAGLEGPSLFVGSSLGDWAARHAQRLGFNRRTSRALLVAGAAAGISGIFKAPLTGLIFALEMPYTDDFAHEALVPSMLASVSSYLVAITLLGPESLFVVNRSYVPTVGSVFLALALGLVVGVAARLFLMSLKFAGEVAESWKLPLVARTAIGGVVCALFGGLGLWLYHGPYAMGSGYELIDASTAGRFIGFAALGLLVLRAGAIVATLGSGAAGGSFIPLVSMGAVTGSVFEALAPATGPLFPIIGMAAFLSAGNATPIAGAVFVAESTGAAGYVIPGLVAAAAAYVVAGGRTLSPHQKPSRRPPVVAALKESERTEA